MRRDQENVGRRVMEMELPGKRKKEKPKRRLKFCFPKQMQSRNKFSLINFFKKTSINKFLKSMNKLYGKIQ